MDIAGLFTSGWHLLIGTILPFLIVLTIIVFIHEMGHFLVARYNKVAVDAFAVGFGPELAGFNDRYGTRWKFCAIPLGGYVKFHGDANAASLQDSEQIAQMDEEERATTFDAKSVGQRAAIVVAGPVANFILAFVIFAGLFMVNGKYVSPPIVSDVVEGGAAQQAGLQKGDLILSIDGYEMESFPDVIRIVAPSANLPLAFVVERDGRKLELSVTPKQVERKNNFGEMTQVGQVGIIHNTDPTARKLESYGPLEAMGKAAQEVWFITARSLYYIGGIFTGQQSTEQLSGPIGIAKISGEVAALGIGSLLSLAAILSVSIGLLNLFPIPMLDGGHLLYYAYEAIMGRPMNEKVQEMGFRVGIVLVLSLMVFATWNDIT